MMAAEPVAAPPQAVGGFDETATARHELSASACCWLLSVVKVEVACSAVVKVRVETLRQEEGECHSCDPVDWFDQVQQRTCWLSSSHVEVVAVLGGSLRH
jgi:hypothetical protein